MQRPPEPEGSPPAWIAPQALGAAIGALLGAALAGHVLPGIWRPLLVASGLAAALAVASLSGSAGGLMFAVPTSFAVAATALVSAWNWPVWRTSA